MNSQRPFDDLVIAFRFAVPRPEDRIPLNKKTWPHLLSPVIPILIMAYLVRRPDTHILRILLFPIVVLTSLRAGYCYVWLEPQYNTYNFGGALFALATIARAIEYASAVDGIKKVGESVPGQSSIPAIATGSPSSSPSQRASLSKRPLGGIIPIPLSDAIEILCAMRGIGFDYGQGVAIPSETLPTAKGPFLKATFRTFVINFLALDLMEATVKLTPPLRSPMGGTIFIPSLPWPKRYVVSTCIHFITGCCIMAGFKMIYSLLTIIGVLILFHSPTAWPPVFDNPWVATSLHDFWARRWHQVLRQTFMVYGGFPGKRLGEFVGGKKWGRLGMLLGTFLASGLFHEFAMYAMGQGIDWRVRMFFLLQGMLVLCERAWRNITGRRVGGWTGTIWVYFTIIILGQPCVDAWHHRGLGGGLVIPPALSPTRRILFPALKISQVLHE